MKILKLNTRKYPDKICLVDDEYYDILLKFKWHPHKDRNNNFYVAARINNKIMMLHRFIIMLTETNIDKLLIDHKDRNGLNNQKENLRVCSNSQNKQNAVKQNIKNGTSKYKGVSVRPYNKFTASIKLCGKTKYIGYFDSEIEAAVAYNYKAIELFGEFACLNSVL